jgi:RNA polymerase sigma-70 factor (ECF subfamily)
MTEDPSLEDDLHAWRRGDPDALVRIVERTRKPLYRFIYGMVGDPHTADDVFQDVWLRAVKGLHRYQSKRLLSWLFRIARNRVIDLSRKRKPDFSLQQPVGGEDGTTTLETFLASDSGTPQQRAGDRELGIRIRRALLDLPTEQREVFTLRMEADLPFKTIAEIQKVSINTALGRMHYALKHLRETLADDYQLLNRSS